MTTLIFKRGDTFGFSAAYTNANGAALSLDGITVTSQVRRADSNDLVANVTVVVTDEEGGTYTLQVLDTSAWPLTNLVWDIKYAYTASGASVRTETVQIKCVAQVTQ